jgi:hypothetical protein
MYVKGLSKGASRAEGTLISNRELPQIPARCQVLEYADVAGAELLRAYCLAVAVCNLDAVLLEARGALETLPRHLLAELERLWKLRLSGGSSSSTSALAAAGEPAAREPAGPEAEEEAMEGAALEGVPGAGQLAQPGGPAGAALRRLGSRLQPGARPTAAAPSLGAWHGVPGTFRARDMCLLGV